MCFDKTGTLTESGLSLQGVASTEHTADGRCKLGPVQPHLAVAAPALQLVAATCHGLAELDGQLVGDPLDQIIFQVGCSLIPRPDALILARCALPFAASGPGMHHCSMLRMLPHSMRPACSQLPPCLQATGWRLQEGTAQAQAQNNPAQARAVDQVEQQAPTKACVQAPGGQQHHMIRRVDFSSELQRAACVVRSPSEAGMVHCTVQRLDPGTGSGDDMDEAGEPLLAGSSHPQGTPHTSASSASSQAEQPGDLNSSSLTGSTSQGPPDAAQHETARLSVCVKGAPEVICRLVTPASVPANLDQILHHQTAEGLRVIALASRQLPPDTTAAEVRLDFCF